MKIKFIFLLLFIPAVAFSQVQTDAQLKTQNTNQIGKKTPEYYGKLHKDLFDTVIDSKVNVSQVSSGTYTPTLTNTTNVAASTAYVTGYYQIGTTVTIFGKVDIDATLSASTATELQISLVPGLTSNFAAEQDAGGTANSDAVASLSARIKADATTDRLSVVFKALSLNNDSYSFEASYQIK